jgi:hypothetical protein
LRPSAGVPGEKGRRRGESVAWVAVVRHDASHKIVEGLKMIAEKDRAAGEGFEDAVVDHPKMPLLGFRCPDHHRRLLRARVQVIKQEREGGEGSLIRREVCRFTVE